MNPRTDSKRQQKRQRDHDLCLAGRKLMFSENTSVDAEITKSGILPAYASTISVLWSLKFFMHA